MKQYIVLSMLIVLAVFQSFGQTNRLLVGLKAGVGMTGTSQTRQSPYPLTRRMMEAFHPRTGVLVGGRISYRLHKHFLVDAGLEYQMMQDEVRRYYQDPTDYRLAITSAHRLQVPIQIRYQLTQRTGSAYLMIGAMPSRLLNLGVTIEGRRNYVVGLEELYYQDPNRIRRFWMPLLVGVGMPIGQHFTLEVTYQKAAKPLEFLRYNPGSTLIGLEPEVSRLNQGLFLSVSYWLTRSIK